MGKITGSKKGETLPSYIFMVGKSWKGVNSKIVEVVAGPGNCGYHGFEVGKEYLVYAHGKEVLEASMCGRTKPVGDTPIELRILDAISRGEKEEGLIKQLPTILVKDSDESARAEAAQMLVLYAPKEMAFEAIPDLIHGLDDKSPKVRKAVLAAFERGPWINVDENTAKIGKAVINSLNDPISEVRRDAAKLLLKYWSVSETVPALLEALKSELARPKPEQEVVRAISSTLARIGTRQAKKEVVPFLITDLSDKNSGIRSNAAEKLGQIGGDAHEAVRPLLGALRDEDRFVRYHAAEALGRVGSRSAIQALSGALKDQELDVRAQAAFSIYSIGDEKILEQEAIPALVNSLNEHKDISSYHIVRVLGDMGPRAYAAVPALSVALRMPGYKYGIAEALGKIGPRAKGAVPALVSILKDADPTTRFYAASALGKIEDHSDAVVQALMSALEDSDAQVQWASVMALNRWGLPQASRHIRNKVVPSVANDLKSGNLDQKRQAANRLGQLRNDAKEAVPNLIEALSDKDVWIRKNSAESLGMIGPEAAPGASKLAELLGDQETRRDAVVALGSMGHKSAAYVSKILPLLNDKDEWTRYCAAEALWKIGTLEAKEVFKKFSDQEIPQLVQRLKDDSRSNRGEAVRYLTHLAPETKAVIPDLIRSLRTDSDWLVRDKSVEALGALGPLADIAIPDLVFALDDRHPYVREAASNALKKIGAPKALRALADFNAPSTPLQ